LVKCAQLAAHQAQMGTSTQAHMLHGKKYLKFAELGGVTPLMKLDAPG
jgi:hypothetical protein